MRPPLYSSLATSAIILLFVFLSVSHQRSPSRNVNVRADEERKQKGEAQLKEMERKAGDSPCWKDAMSRLNSTCKLMTDIEQSRLAVAFANCHLDKSGRQTYPCTSSMTIKECTIDMDHDAFQTYTHFFTNTGHICYFLQNEIWQERTEGLIGKLSDTSTETVEKLEQALEYHEIMDEKQTVALSNQEVILEQDRKIATSLDQTRQSMDRAFSDMTEMAERQKILLSEMFGSLQSSVDSVRFLMSLLLVEFIGYETFAAFVVSWLVIIFLPQFSYSRFKLHIVLFTNLALEIVVRRIYAHYVLGGSSQPTAESLVRLPL